MQNPENITMDYKIRTVNKRLNQLEKSLSEGKFCITAELVPALTTDQGSILTEVESVRGLVEAINVTDGAAANTTMSSFAAAAILATNEIEPVLQLTCRDRNRIALCADLIGAAAFGICNLLPLTGDDPAFGDQPEAKSVHDINSAELITLARDMSDKGILPNGREIDSPPYFHIGCADIPQRIKNDASAAGLIKKIDAGARFVQTQLCYDIDLIEGYIADLGERGILDRVKILIGLGPIASAKSARWMKENLWGVTIPDAVLQRLDDSSDPKQEGRRICVELIEAMQKNKGIAGVHLMAPGQSTQAIANLLSELD